MSFLGKNWVSLFRLTTGFLRGRDYPFVTVLRLNDACNMTCTYCDSPKLTGAVDFIKLEKFLNKVYAKGCRFFILSGGEPFLYSSRDELMAWFRARRAYLVINTNGKAIGSKLYQDFLRHADEVLTSLDGPEEYNDRLRGRGSYAKVIALLEFLKKENIKPTLSAVLTAENTDSRTLEHLLELKKKYGASAGLSPITGKGRINNEAYSTQHALKPEQFETLKSFISKNQKAFPEVPRPLVDYFAKPTPFSCKTYKYALYVDVNHKIYPCINVTDREDAQLTDISDYGGRLEKTISCQSCDCTPLVLGNLFLQRKVPKFAHVISILSRFIPPLRTVV